MDNEDLGWVPPSWNPVGGQPPEEDTGSSDDISSKFEGVTPRTDTYDDDSLVFYALIPGFFSTPPNPAEFGPVRTDRSFPGRGSFGTLFPSYDSGPRTPPSGHYDHD